MVAMKKLNLTQQKRTCISKQKNAIGTTENKKLKPVWKDLYDVPTGNKSGLF